MSEKYIDLAQKISRDCGYMSSEAWRALSWLDAHRDQVPGRTITESEFHETADAHRNGGLGWEDLANRLGITVVPDPEPTNAEKLAEDLMKADRDGGHAYRDGYYGIAQYLIDHGWTKEPGGDDEH